ncbi:MAG: LytTR family DNA-binding domain-containing protein [Eubacteriales bacterium]
MNCLIIDDEQPSRKELRFFIENHSSIEVLEEFEDSIEALNFFKTTNNVDIIFLDINMPNLDGMDLANILYNFKKKPLIVFVTAYKEYAHDAFKVEAFDYLLKPYSEERIINILNKLERTIKTAAPNKESKVTLSDGEKIIVLKKEEIICVKAQERKTEIFFNKDKFISNKKISDLEKELCETNFFRTHRSYIVNLDKVKEIDFYFNNTYLLILKNMEEKVPVSRSYIKEFRQVMNL